jgi:transposase InsO family protein
MTATEPGGTPDLAEDAPPSPADHSVLEAVFLVAGVTLYSAGLNKYDADVITFLKATGLKRKRTSVQSPWQNGVSERWVGSCRREILDHVIPLNEEHLRRLLRDFANYYHQDRVHDSLQKDTPNRRPVERKPSPDAVVISSARLGGLHHRYTWREAA